jgi:2-isopropylmalate synthase
MKPSDLVYDWNQSGPMEALIRSRVELDDETLRDGLQSPSVRDPAMDVKVRLLHLMDQLGIDTADIGLPGAGPRAVEQAETLAREIGSAKLSIQANCAARTLARDIEPIANIVHKTGVPIESYLFLGCSPIRQYVEAWDLEKVMKLSGDAIRFAAGEGLQVAFVTEDTTRSSPETLRPLYLNAIEKGARRITMCDTVGHACPAGVSNLVKFVRGVIAETGVDVKLDWHGHSDRGLSLTNAFMAVHEGVDRVHGTALGVGERVGNTPMDQLLVNLRLFGVNNIDLSPLVEYVELAHAKLGAPLPYNYPMFGEDAFRTATGVHAAAVLKALEMGDDWLADRVYSGIPAGWLGRRQNIQVGPMSGASNVRHWFLEHGREATETSVEQVLAAAKRSDHVLTDDEINGILDGAA